MINQTRMKRGLWTTLETSIDERDLIEKPSESHLGIVLVERLVVDMLEVKDVFEEKTQGKHEEHQNWKHEEMPFFYSLNSKKNMGNKFLLFFKNGNLKTKRTMGTERTPTSQTCFLCILFSRTKKTVIKNTNQTHPNILRLNL